MTCTPSRKPLKEFLMSWREPWKSVVDQQADPQMAAQMKAYDFHKVIDNEYVSKLVKEGFFEKLYGPSIKAEEQRKAKLAYGK